MRKLPVYLLLDTSGSMHGAPMEAVNKGVDTMIRSLRQNPQAIETAYISIITFDAAAMQVIPLTDLASFQMMTLQASGTTSLGAALSLLSQKIDVEVAKTTMEKKGDWKPIVFIMTDGVPTDDWRLGLQEFQQRKVSMVIACAAGEKADTSVLQQITPNVVRLETADEQSISQFFTWVSASIGVSSEKVEESGKEASGLKDLPPPPSELNIVV